MSQRTLLLSTESAILFTLIDTAFYVVDSSSVMQKYWNYCQINPYWTLFLKWEEDETHVLLSHAWVANATNNVNYKQFDLSVNSNSKVVNVPQSHDDVLIEKLSPISRTTHVI